MEGSSFPALTMTEFCDEISRNTQRGWNFPHSSSWTLYHGIKFTISYEDW
jgi:hypothetical protein